jgi:hypothetical protein
MKFLEINEESERHLVTVIDAALKSGGLQMHHVVNALFSFIKEKDTNLSVSE